MSSTQEPNQNEPKEHVIVSQIETQEDEPSIKTPEKDQDYI